MSHDPSDLGSLILVRIIPLERITSNLEEVSNIPSLWLYIALAASFPDKYPINRPSFQARKLKKLFHIFPSELKNSFYAGYSKTISDWTSDQISDQNWIGEMKQYAKYIAWWMLSTFWRVSGRKKPQSVYILKPYLQIGQCLKKSLPGGSLVKNLKTFWMNNNRKTIIEFGIRMIWRIMQRGCYPPRPSALEKKIPSSTCIILHIIRMPNSTIVKHPHTERSLKSKFQSKENVAF